MRRLVGVFLVSLPFAMTGCGPAVRFAPENGVHVVQRGETLYSIATAYDMDWKKIARSNGMHPPYTILVGQRLRVTGPASSHESPGHAPQARASRSSNDEDEPNDAPAPPIGATRWVWPTEGRVVSTFLHGHATRKGIDIAGTLGQPVRAAAAGEVVYSGSGLAGYGNLIILKHDSRILSAYAYNQDLLVSEGQRVQSGQIIAHMGQSEVDRPRLHFEIRLDGNPIDPLRQLPRIPR